MVWAGLLRAIMASFLALKNNERLKKLILVKTVYLAMLIIVKEVIVDFQIIRRMMKQRGI